MIVILIDIDKINKIVIYGDNKKSLILFKRSGLANSTNRLNNCLIKSSAHTLKQPLYIHIILMYNIPYITLMQYHH